MKKSKKIFLGMGSIAAVAAPIAAVVSCADANSATVKEVSGAFAKNTQSDLNGTWAVTEDGKVATATYTTKDDSLLFEVSNLVDADGNVNVAAVTAIVNGAKLSVEDQKLFDVKDQKVEVSYTGVTQAVANEVKNSKGKKYSDEYSAATTPKAKAEIFKEWLSAVMSLYEEAKEKYLNDMTDANKTALENAGGTVTLSDDFSSFASFSAVPYTIEVMGQTVEVANLYIVTVTYNENNSKDNYFGDERIASDSFVVKTTSGTAFTATVTLVK